MKKGKIAKAAVAVLSMLTIGAGFAACDSCNGDDEHTHNWGAWEIVGTYPTLTGGGKAERYCTDDDGGKETKDLPNLTDKSVWTENLDAAEDATHMKEGSRTFTSEYGTVKITVDKIDEHEYGDWTLVEGTPLSLTEGGQIQRVCKANDKTETKDVPALSVEEFWTKTVNEEPNHQKAGSADFVSKEYKGIEVKGVVLDKIPHDFGDWVISREPSKTEEGEVTRTCNLDSCEGDKTATETKVLKALSDAESWDVETVTADYNHAGSETYTHKTYGVTVTKVTAPKLVAPYDNKTYCAGEIGVNSSGTASTYAWSGAFLQVGEDGIGYGTAHPFIGKFVFEMVDAATGLVKVTKYAADANAESGYSDTASGGFSAYVDFETGFLALTEENDWSKVFVAVPTETSVELNDFAASASNGMFAISYTKDGTPFNILVSDNSVAFGVTFADLNGNALTAANAFDLTRVYNLADLVFVSKGETTVKVFTRTDADSKEKFVVSDGLHGYYAIDANTKLAINGAGMAAIMDASGNVIDGGEYRIVSNTADKRAIGIILEDEENEMQGMTYYEYTLSGDGMSDGTCTVKAPKVTITFNFNGVEVDNGEGKPFGKPEISYTVSQFVPFDNFSLDSADGSMQFMGWYKDAECTQPVELVNGSDIVPAETCTLYAKWAETVEVNVVDENGGNTTIYVGAGSKLSESLEYEALQLNGDNTKYFDGWYLDAEFKTAVQADAVINKADSGKTTVYAKWTNVNILYGEYNGRQLLSGGVVYAAEIKVTVNGEIKGKLTLNNREVEVNGKFASYDAASQVVEWIPASNQDVTYVMWYDTVNGLLVIPDELSKTQMDTYPFMLSRYSTIDENQFIDYSASGAIMGNKTQLIEVDGVLTLKFDDKIYSGVTLSDVFGEVGLSIHDFNNSKTLVVMQGEKEIMAIGTTADSFGVKKDEFGKAAVVKALDSYRGVKVAVFVDEGENEVEVKVNFRLDGLGNVTWNYGANAGIYSLVDTEDDGETAVLGIYERERKTNTSTSEDDDGETTTTTTVTYSNVAYHELRLGATNSFVKPQVKIEFVSVKGEVEDEIADVHVNKNIVYVPEDIDDSDVADYVFRGWYLDDKFKNPVGEGYVPTGDVTLYAKWLEKVILTVDYKDGDDDASRTETFSYGKGETIKLEDPERMGCKFDGWYINEETPFADTEINENITIFAKWKLAGNYVHTYYVLYISENSTAGTDTKDFRSGWITFNTNGNSTSNSWPFGGNATTITDYDDVTGLMLIDTVSGQVGVGVHRAVNDLATGVIVLNDNVGEDADFGKLFVLMPEVTLSNSIENYSESYWNDGKTRAISFDWPEHAGYTIFVHGKNVYFNASFETADGDPVAANAAYQSTTLYVRDAEGGLIAKFGYNGEVMGALDGYEEITYTGTLGDLTVNGVATVKLDGVAGTYALNGEAEYTADVYVGGSYYEVTLDKDNSTYTVNKPMVTVTYVTEFDAANAVSGDMNKNIMFNLPALTDATHIFRGWYIEGAETELLNGEYTPTAGVTLHAKWDIKATLTVVYGNGMTTVNIEYGVGDTVTLEDPAYTNGNAFDHWYLSDDEGVTEKAEYTVGVIEADTTVYAKWVEAVAAFGTYKGLYFSVSTNSWDYISKNTSARDFAIDKEGNVTGYYAEGSVISEIVNGKFHAVKGANYHYGFYDEANGLILMNTTSGSTETLGTNWFFAVKDATAISGLGSQWVSNKTGKRSAAFTLTITKGSEVYELNILVDEGLVMYTNVTFLKNGTTKADAKDSYVYNGSMKVLDANGGELISYKAISNRYEKADGLTGTYTSTNGSMTLDGFGTITAITDSQFGLTNATGTYNAAAAGAEYDYDVVINSENYEMTLDVDGSTYTLVKPMFTVSFNLGGKTLTSDSSAVATQTINKGKYLTPPSGLTTDGFKFGGWYKDYNAEDGTYANEVSSSFAVTADTTLYAKWLAAVAITFDYQAGEDHPNGSMSTKVEGDTLLVWELPEVDFEYNNQLFGGWYNDPECTNKFNAPLTLTAAGKTLYAKWVTKRTVTLNKNNGLGEGTLPYKDGDTVPVPDRLPYTDGKMFKGWFTDPECTQEYTATVITADFPLYAKWEESAPYKIENGGDTAEHHWVYNSEMWESNIAGASNSSCVLKITAYTDMTVTFQYRASSENATSYDYFSTLINDGSEANKDGGAALLDSREFKTATITLKAGDVLTLRYKKDSGVDKGDDKAQVKDLVVNGDSIVSTDGTTPVKKAE